MTPSIRPRRLGAAAVVAVALAVAACGSDDPRDAVTTDAATQEAATEEAATDEAATGEPAAGDGATDEAAGEPTGGDGAGSAGGSIDGVDAVLEAATPLDYDPAAITIATVDGGSFAATDVAGPVVYWFWAPWCTICRGEAPEVADIAADYDGRVTFVGVAGLGPVEDMRGFVADTGVDGFVHAVDADGSVWTGFGVFSQPSYVFVDAAGQARTWTGGLDGDTLREVTGALAG